MGEMAKFGIKLAMTIACALSLIAAILILYNIISNFVLTNTQISWLSDISKIVSLVFPVNIRTLFTCLSTLFSFKVAYWAADKLIQFIGATS